MTRDLRLDTGAPTAQDRAPSETGAEARSEAELEAMLDLFQTTLRELNNEAPIELLTSLRESLEHIRVSNPSSAYTAKACLIGLASDRSTLLHVLAAAFLVNGGVMLKHSPPSDAAPAAELADSAYEDLDFKELEIELNRLSEGRHALPDD